MRHNLGIIFLFTLLMQIGCASDGITTEMEARTARDEQLRRAEISEQSGAVYKALAIYQVLLTETPDDAVVLQRAAGLAERIGEISSAAGWYEELSRIQPDTIEWSEHLAMSQIQLGRLDEARTTLESISRTNPTRWMAWSGLGLLADIDGKYKEATTYHGRAIELGYEQHMAYNNLGYSQLMAKQYYEAEVTFRRGLSFASFNERLHNNLILAIAWQGRYEDAIQEGRTVFKEWIVHNNVGYIALQRGDYSAAIAMFKSSLSLSPSYYPKAAENLRKALLAQDKH